MGNNNMSKTKANDNVTALLIQRKPGEDSYHHHTVDGLTKREYFAAAALTGMFANSSYDQTVENDVEVAVNAADQLIIKLNEKKENEPI